MRHLDNTYVYLSDGKFMVFSVAIEGGIELSLASCGQNPNDFITVVSLVLDGLMKNISF